MKMVKLLLASSIYPPTAIFTIFTGKAILCCSTMQSEQPLVKVQRCDHYNNVVYLQDIIKWRNSKQ